MIGGAYLISFRHIYSNAGDGTDAGNGTSNVYLIILHKYFVYIKILIKTKDSISYFNIIKFVHFSNCI